MNKEHLTVILKPDGTVSVEAHGYKGKSCEEASAFIEKALGIGGTRKKKPEYYQDSKVVRAQRT